MGFGKYEQNVVATKLHFYIYAVPFFQFEIFCATIAMVSSCMVVNKTLNEKYPNSIFLPGAFFYKHGLTLVPAWISDYIHHKVWDEITCSFPNFNGCTVEIRVRGGGGGGVMSL